MKLHTYLLRIILGFCLLAGNALPAVADQQTAAAESSACISTGWPFDRSDLQPDPSLRHGVLKNGFRYVLKENPEPKNRVAVYLNVQAGSLHETDEQRGYAHFLEHMLFNGSTNFKPGELVEYFQSIGMSFGGDTNAHTSFDETVYHIILPGSDRRQLEKGLLVMADYARGALLLESEIERERGVILSEKGQGIQQNTAPMSPAANSPCVEPSCPRGCPSALTRRSGRLDTACSKVTTMPGTDRRICSWWWWGISAWRQWSLW